MTHSLVSELLEVFHGDSYTFWFKCTQDSIATIKSKQILFSLKKEFKNNTTILYTCLISLSKKLIIHPTIIPSVQENTSCM